MSPTMSLNDLLEYTDWERQKWRSTLQPAALALSVGPHGDGRLQTLGEVVRHIFSAEKRYAERLQGLPVSDTSAIPTHDVEALFKFGDESRKTMRALVTNFPAAKWDDAIEFKMMNSVLTMTPKKIAVHTLMHEVRHWAQIATLLRQNGMAADFHDFLFSPVFGGEIRREQMA